MGLIGFLISLVAGLFMLIGLIPILGWWVSLFFTLPLSVAGAAVSGLGLSKRRNGLAIAGLVISLVVFVIAMARLYVGCGVI